MVGAFENSAETLTPPYDARVVANYIISRHIAGGHQLTQLRLYKLMYFAHGWYLAEFREPLVWNSFEAWEFGPVIKVVRDCFKSFGVNHIAEYCGMFDLRSGEHISLPSRLQSRDEGFVDAVIAAYAKYSAEELSEITHVRGSPWEKIWKARGPVGGFGLRMSNDDILRDFQDVVEKPDVRYKGGFPNFG